MITLTDFRHAAIRVMELEASEAFYSGLLGMPVIARFPDDRELLLAVGNDHLLIGETTDDLGVGLHHVAFGCADLDTAGESLAAHGVPYRNVDHETYCSIYCRDPDQHLVELCGPEEPKSGP